MCLDIMSKTTKILSQNAMSRNSDSKLARPENEANTVTSGKKKKKYRVIQKEVYTFKTVFYK
jgi:hypothetical protein